MALATILVVIIFLSSKTLEATSRGDLFEDSAVEKHEQWMARFQRVYGDEAEKRMRFDIFKKNLEFVNSINMNPDNSYKLDVNEFSDLTDEEFRGTYTGLVPEVSTLYSQDTGPFKYGNVSDVGDSKLRLETGGGRYTH